MARPNERLARRLVRDLRALASTTPAPRQPTLGEAAVGLLRRLVEKDPIETIDGELGIYRCGHCDGPVNYETGRGATADHRPDCPWLAARAFLDGLSEEGEG